MRRPVSVKAHVVAGWGPLAVVHPASIRTLCRPHLARCTLGSDCRGAAVCLRARCLPKAPFTQSPGHGVRFRSRLPRSL